MFGKRSKDSPSRASWVGGRPERWLTTTGLVVCFVLLAGPVGLGQRPPTTAGSGPEATTITLSPSSSTITACDTIQVEIWVNDVVDLYGGDFQVTFDPTKLEVVDADPILGGVQIEPLSGFLEPDWVLRKVADNTAGTVWYAATHTNPRGPVSGSGAVARFTLRALGGGTPDLTWYDTAVATKLATKEGAEIPATPVPSTLTTVPPPAPTLTIVKQTTTTARLSWTGVTGIAEYHLYRDTAPYFTPAGTPHQTTTSLSYDDAGVLGNPATNYYYVVRSSCDNGFESENSNRVGEFDFALTGPGYSLVALPLIVPAISDAASLAAYTCTPDCVSQVWNWVATAQDWQYYLPALPFPETNFLTRTGGAYFLRFDGAAPATLTLAGGVPDQESITFSLVAGSGGACSTNFVSLPLDKDEITDPDELAADMGDTVDQVWSWDESSQDWLYWLPKFSIGDEIDTRIGYPYVVCSDSSAPSVWPVY